MIIGYARVSTEGQTLEAQQASLLGAGATKVFAEKISGAVTDRKALARAIATLGPADVLLVTRLDRLARSTRDLLNTLDTIASGAGFRSLADRGRNAPRFWGWGWGQGPSAKTRQRTNNKQQTARAPTI
jgi:DNA invertase Pin-like site-specific DNA recombinase